MTPSTMRRLVVASTALAATVLVPWAAAAAPEDVPETGVWWELQPSDGALAPPGRDLSDGALWLQSTPRGDSAVSALRLSAPSGHRVSALVLTVREDRSAPALTGFDLCPALEVWSPPEGRPGAWAGRALPDCAAGRVQGGLSDDGSTVRFDLAGLPPLPVLDVVLTGSEGGGSVTDVVLEAPAPSALITEPVGEGVPTTGVDSGPPADAGPEQQPAAGDGGFGTGLPPFAPGDDVGSAPLGPEIGLPPLVDATDPGPPGPDLAPAEVATPAVASPAAFGAGPAELGDAGRRAAAVALTAVLLWAAVLLQRLRATGSWTAGPAYTLYRGAPPRPAQH